MIDYTLNYVVYYFNAKAQRVIVGNFRSASDARRAADKTFNNLALQGDRFNLTTFGPLTPSELKAFINKA